MSKLPIAITKLYSAKLASSGLTIKDAETLGMSIAQPSTMQKRNLPEGWAIEMPYFDPKKIKSDFKRYRYLEDNRSEKQIRTGDKPLRYVQEAGTINEVYLPPNIDWEDVINNPSIRVVITEGELKAAAMCKLGVYCVALGGVWCFKSAAHKLAVIPTLSAFDWRERVVTIIFDSDMQVNPDVQAAANELAIILSDAGAHVRIGSLPYDKYVKTGLDDYIVAKGADARAAVEQIITDAVDFAGSRMLFELNNEVVLLRDSLTVVRLSNYQRISPRNFCEVAYADWTYKIETPSAGGGTRFIEKSAPKQWLKWPARYTLAGATYEPGKPPIYQEQLNVWPGFATQPVKGDVSLWFELLHHLFGDDAKEAQTWFEKWCAYPLQQPGVKLFTAAALWATVQGTGKSLVGETLGKIYGSNYTMIDESKFTGNHNGWAENKQFVLVDDVDGRTNRLNASLLKTMITRQVMWLNPKYIPEYEVPDKINYLFTSNNSDAFYLDDNDRRFFIHRVISQPLNQEFYNAYSKWKNTPQCMGHLLDHFLNLDCTGFNPNAPAFFTPSKAAMIEDGKSELALWAHHLRSYPDQVLTKNYGKEPIPFDLFRTEDLLKAFDPYNQSKVTINGMVKALIAANVVRPTESRCTTSFGYVKLWLVRNHDKYRYLSSAELGASYDKERALDKHEAKSKTKRSKY